MLGYINDICKLDQKLKDYCGLISLSYGRRAMSQSTGRLVLIVIIRIIRIIIIMTIPCPSAYSRQYLAPWSQCKNPAELYRIDALA